MSIINAHPLLAAAGDDGYQISRSVRLRSSASAYLNRTFGTPTNNKIYAWSIWVKRGDLTATTIFVLASCPTAGFLSFGDGTNPVIRWNDGTADIITSSVYRDPSAWYHIVVAVDTTQATAANRVKIYVNGVQLTSFSTASYPSLNASQNWNSAGTHNIGRRVSTSTLYYDGYLTEINFIDGQALTPSSFGETNAITGVWQPKAYSGTYGTNGFELTFADNSNNTAATIGKDYSGNGNNWTPNVISVTAGATYDSMLDVPTPYADGGNGRGNYAVLNPLDKTSISPTYSNGNLAISAGASWAYSRATMLLPSNVKIYAETTLGSNTNGTSAIQSGFARAGFAMGTNGYYVNHDSVGQIYTAGSLTASGLGALVAGDVIQFAYDGAGNAWIGKNNVWWNSSGGTTGNPATGANPTFTGLSAYDLFISTGNYSNSQNINFGQRPFAYTPPTGFVALNTQNLPAPTISNGANYMAATTYTGTGSALSVSNAVNGVSFQPDLVWVKGRNGATDHALYDAVRGVQKQLESNTTTEETTETTGLTAFGSTGFTVGALAQMNTNTATYVGWQWNAGGSTVTNTSGTISSQVRANPTAGFSVVTYTGTGANATVGHGLNATPAMIMVKNRDSGAIGGAVYHTSMGATKYLKLFQTTTGSDKEATDNTAWNGGSPTFNSSVFSVGSLNRTNSSQQMVAYCFAAVAGYSAFGSYTGNGAADGPFVYLGFRPRFVLVKRTDVAATWYIWNTSSNTFNVIDTALFPNLTNAESSNVAYYCDILSNGFKPRATNTDVNASGGTYIYAAFSEVGFKYALGR
jgi:hypothetical protein